MSGAKIHINAADRARLKFMIAPNPRNSQTPDLTGLTEYAREGTERHWLQIISRRPNMAYPVHIVPACHFLNDGIAFLFWVVPACLTYTLAYRYGFDT